MKTIKESLSGRLPCTDLEYDLMDWCYERDRRIEGLKSIIRSALENADRLPFVVGVQFEDAKRMREVLKDDN